MSFRAVGDGTLGPLQKPGAPDARACLPCLSCEATLATAVLQLHTAAADPAVERRIGICIRFV